MRHEIIWGFSPCGIDFHFVNNPSVPRGTLGPAVRSAMFHVEHCRFPVVVEFETIAI
jgi:hypothetical protein